MQYMFVSSHVGSKKIVSAAYNFRSHYKQLFGLKNFRRLGPNVFFEISGANCSSCKHFRRVVIWCFVGRADPYQNTEAGLNRFISDCAKRLRTWPEIVIFYEMPRLRPPTRGSVTPRRPYYLDFSRGLPVVQIFLVTVLDTRMRTYLWNDKLRTYLNNSTNSPLLPSNTPPRGQNLMLLFGRSWSFL